MTCLQVKDVLGDQLEAVYEVIGGSDSEPPTGLRLDPAGLPDEVLQATQAFFTVQAVRLLQPLRNLEAAAAAGRFESGVQFSLIGMSSRALVLDKQAPLPKAILLSKCVPAVAS